MNNATHDPAGEQSPERVTQEGASSSALRRCETCGSPMHPDQPRCGLCAWEALPEASAPIIDRPLWADRSSFNHDTGELVGLAHSWDAPTVPQVTEVDHTGPLLVTVHQIDDLVIGPDGVRLEPGRAEICIFGLDLVFPDTTEARKLAAALVEAADRLDKLGGLR